MSEPIWMQFKVGGTLPSTLIEPLLDALQEECYEITGPTTEQELRKEATEKKSILWYAIANYGEPDTLKAFCKDNRLSYTHYCEATGEYDSTLAYWLPGMKREFVIKSDSNSDAVVNVAEIKPYVDFLLEYVKSGKDALPLFVGVPSLEDILEKCLKNPKKTLDIIKKKLDTLLPGAPTLPPFIIKE